MNKSFDFKKSLGQNFLKDENIIRKIINQVNVNKDDLVIEIGPGAGSLTKYLKDLDSRVFCFEIDTRLKDELEKYKSDKLDIIFEDFLNVNLKDFLSDKKYKKLVFIGNLPYYISTAIINKITSECNADEIIIMVQKEVADRFMATEGCKQCGSISVFLNYNYDIKRVVNVPKECFVPKPKIDSSVVKFVKKEKLYVKDEKFFYKFIKDAFMHKRKNLRNNLYTYDLEIIEKVLKSFGKDLRSRAEELSLEVFVNISNELLNNLS